MIPQTSVLKETFCKLKVKPLFRNIFILMNLTNIQNSKFLLYTRKVSQHVVVREEIKFSNLDYF